MNEIPTRAIIALFVAFGLFVWILISARKNFIKDWNILKELEKKANEVSTKEEIEEFHKEFTDKASKINDDHIKPHLMRIDGYLKGLYKQYKT